ncbi:uncharacterized protein K02A2.6-like [Octopus bimaculoides]|uniref:uncharacterized protein K02A2.6-like n=1 Tax=Octopus bimaculoides TaxID=37653 RepID=UPI00071C61E8|nr:uncharacterized protein K02A2.6-like [Octopus bimaculoides]|eukprot:XP_014772973.1 PREDICTED: uncharacterized protein K02A2.6-like [Octopus bimaculoides]
MEYILSKKLSHVDCLSRLISKNVESLEDTVIAVLRAENEIKNVLCNVIRELPVTLQDIILKLVNDRFIIKMKEIFKAKRDKDMRSTNANYFSHCDNVLMYAQKVVVPATLQKRLLKEFHIGQRGISKMRSLMRGYVYWSTMDRALKNQGKHAEGVPQLKYHLPLNGNRGSKQMFHGPNCMFIVKRRSYYLVVVNRFSKWPEVYKCKKPTSVVTTSFLHELFTRYGIPNTIVSDNGTQFTSDEFIKFCKMLAILAYHPWSNGQADLFDDTFKWALKRSEQ